MPVPINDIYNIFATGMAQRLYAFGISLGAGIFSSLLGSFFIFTLNFTAFGVMYTLGNIFCLASIMFLVGPGYQVRNMFRNYRAVATLVYLSTLVLTLFAALYLHNAILVLLSVIVQSLAMIWYTLSYIPFARHAVSRTLNWCCGDIE